MADKFVSNDGLQERCTDCSSNSDASFCPIPVRRIVDKLNLYFDKKDYDSTERLLSYWLSESEKNGDTAGKLFILNEQAGLYRKLERKNEAFLSVERALKLVNDEGFGEDIPGATTYVNSATVYKSFGEVQKALELFKKGRVIYEKLLSQDDIRFGGLYNNMALALTELKFFDEAKELFDKAMDIVQKNTFGNYEAAITCCNLCDWAAASLGAEKAEKIIEEYLNKAYCYLDTDALPRDGYYAFVCEKCAPTFGYYGFFEAERELMRRAEEYYERA